MSTCARCSTEGSTYETWLGDVGPDPRHPAVIRLCAACHPFLVRDPPRDDPPADHEIYDYTCGRVRDDGGRCVIGVSVPWMFCQYHAGRPVADPPDPDEPPAEPPDHTDQDSGRVETAAPSSWAEVSIQHSTPGVGDSSSFGAV